MSYKIIVCNAQFENIVYLRPHKTKPSQVFQFCKGFEGFGFAKTVCQQVSLIKAKDVISLIKEEGIGKNMIAVNVVFGHYRIDKFFESIGDDKYPAPVLFEKIFIAGEGG